MGVRSILIASPEESAVRKIREYLAKQYRIDVVGNREACLEYFRRKRYEFTFIDIAFLKFANSSNRQHYKDALQPFWQAYPTAQIIVLSLPRDIREAVAAVKAGAATYLTYPADPHELEFVLKSLSDYQKIEAELFHLREDNLQIDAAEGVRTNSRIMKDVLNKLRSVAPTKTNVLLTGETGSGKGVLARLIHRYSNRSDGPFIAVHCGAIPDTLLESEFFGHEKGAFTGAVRRKLGKFQIADSGTLFLDEIGTISPAAQVKMLQVLQERSFSRVGGEETIEVDIRLIAATNMDLKKLCHDGLFREDLFFRINVFPIEVPPLRKRPEDIPLLVDIFLDRLNRSNTKEIRGVYPEVMETLMRYSWPGNIRELENLIERAFILETGPILTAESFPSELFSFEGLGEGMSANEPPTLEEVRRLAVQQVEKRYLREVLAIYKGRIDQTAGVAGVTTRQLHNLMTRYGLRKEEFK
jgi:DNA-binding NtrC family response regulator